MPFIEARGAVMGTSLEAYAYNAPNWTPNGWAAWLRRYAKGAIDLPVSRIFATVGVNSTYIVAN
jgi:hypothetical protein